MSNFFDAPTKVSVPARRWMGMPNGGCKRFRNSAGPSRGGRSERTVRFDEKLLVADLVQDHLQSVADDIAEREAAARKRRDIQARKRAAKARRERQERAERAQAERETRLSSSWTDSDHPRDAILVVVRSSLKGRVRVTPVGVVRTMHNGMGRQRHKFVALQ